MLALLNKAFLQNPRTSFAGIGTILSTLLAVFKVITPEQGAVIAAAFMSFGLILSGDAK